MRIYHNLLFKVNKWFQNAFILFGVSTEFRTGARGTYNVSSNV
jgi:hypothetical protein